MMNNSKLDLFQKYIDKEEQRSKIPITGELQACLDYCQYTIRTQFDKHSKSKYKFKKRKGSVSEDFMRAFNEFSNQDKIAYYNKNVTYLVRLHKHFMKPPQVEDIQLKIQAFIRSRKLKRWKKYNLRLDCRKKVLFSERNQEIKEFNLGDYILRGSKNTDYYAYVLQSISVSVGDKYKTIHIGFEDIQKMMEWGNNTQLCIDYKHWERIYIELYKQAPKFSKIQKKPSKPEKQKKQVEDDMKKIQKVPNMQQSKCQPFVLPKYEEPPAKKYVEEKKNIDKQKIESQAHTEDANLLDRTIVDDLLDSDADNDSIGEIQEKNKVNINQQKTRANMFHKIFPDYDLHQLEDQANMKMIQYVDGQFRIMQDMGNPLRHKIFINIENRGTKSENILNALSGPQLIPEYNNNVEQVSVKTFISSQNSAILYMKNKPYNKFYRSRDFVFIRHSFKDHKNFYIADHELDNINFPPFITIVRGSYSCVWGILEKKNQFLVVGDIQMKNEGYLNEIQNSNLTLNFLRGFSFLQRYLLKNQKKLLSYKMFSFNWDISRMKEQKNRMINVRQTRTSKNSFARKSISQSIKSQTNQDKPQLKQQQKLHEKGNFNKQKTEQKPISPNQKTKQSEVQTKVNIKSPQKKEDHADNSQLSKSRMQVDPLEEEKIIQNTMKSINLQFDEEGYVIITKQFRSNRYQLEPENKKKVKPIFVEFINGIHPLWKGQWAPEKKQGGLLFIDQKKMQDQKGVLKFVLTKIGKNLLSGKSVLNISLPVDIFCPQSNLELFAQSMTYAPLLIQPALSKSDFEKFKAVTVFGLTMSPLYLRMQKPFNPILGETFQAWINGCPAYAEQISHHPPISSLLFYGRGYRIDAQLESKVELHMNSGCGTNDGVFRFKFDSGQQICYTSPGGEISGLTYGQRKFNLVGKSYVWMKKNNLFLQIAFNPNKKGFFSTGKQQNPVDYFEGYASEVRPQFFGKFDLQKKKGPSQSDIVKKIGKFHGIWHKSIHFENEVLLNYDITLPYKMEYQKIALPSDANWREDIAYRRLMQVSKAQTEKQRLQNIQRRDRKLRGEKKK